MELFLLPKRAKVCLVFGLSVSAHARGVKDFDGKLGKKSPPKQKDLTKEFICCNIFQRVLLPEDLPCGVPKLLV